MSDIAKRASNALHTNPNVFHYPDTSQINITTHGSNIYWAITALMAFSAIMVIGDAHRLDRKKRTFHFITAAITLVASIAYFTMASNLGYAAIIVEFMRNDPNVAGTYREVFYVRYIDWFVTTPLLLLDLLLTAGLPWSTILYTILLDEIMIVTGLVGALVASSYKWGYFVFATVALFGIAYNVTWVGRMHANSKGDAVRNTYLKCGVWTICLWFIYPIAWGLCEGGNVISPDSEAIFYSVLDVLAKPVFGALLLYGHRDIDPEFIGVRIGDYDPPRAQRGEEANNRINNDAHSEIINGAQPNGQVPNPSNNVIPQGALPTGRSSRESATARVSKEENVGNGNGPSFSA